MLYLYFILQFQARFWNVNNGLVLPELSQIPIPSAVSLLSPEVTLPYLRTKKMMICKKWLNQRGTTVLANDQILWAGIGGS